MRVGVTFPQTEIGTDPGSIRAFAEAAEDLGYDYLLAYDHVLGADLTSRPDWTGTHHSGRPPYTVATPFHEPFVLFAYLAAVTQRLELFTGVLVLPQRQTPLVAKQAAEVDVLSNGRLRLGIGIGWNDVEYAGMGADFRTRGAKSEEQIALLRALWTQEVVSYEGRWDRLDAVGINPLPVQRPIPIWIGGRADVVLRRTVRIADGFVSGFPDVEEGMETLRRIADEEGCDLSTLGIAGGALLASGFDQAVARIETWREAGATHCNFATMDAGLKSPDEHIDAIRRFKDALGKTGP